MSKTLPFKVSPEFLEDLGVNLYTSLDKVLVEFIANSHDADSKQVDVALDVQAIDLERKKLLNRWKEEREEATNLGNPQPEPLEGRTLDEKWKIVVEDNGEGMSEDDLKNKFLQVSRRKRADDGTHSPGGRVFMGRKGLGKLAGFGVAQKIVITSLKKGETCATKIILDYNEIKKFPSMADVEVPCETLQDKGEIVGNHGTRIELTRLVYSGLRGTQSTALRHAVDCFWMVDAGDFAILHNGQPVESTVRKYEWVYPQETGRADEDLLHRKITLSGTDYDIRYRIRFTPSKGQLKSHEYGVRVYAHKRLASIPSLFEVPSSSTGFKYTAYLDGVVVADFVDEQPTDYIGTNRQGLRWETPLLADLHDWIHNEIKTALKEFYATKEDTIRDRVTGDEFTKAVINQADLPNHREKLAYNIAVILAKGDSDETESSFYKKSLPIVVQGLTRGDVLSAIATLSSEESPHMADVLREVTELTKQEFGDFLAIVQGRLDGIAALKKIRKNQDFHSPDNEKELQKLFEGNPWLIDPTFFQFMSADETQSSMNDRLANYLKIGKYCDVDLTEENETKAYGDNKRPDLSFVLGNSPLAKIVIVELKSPNTPLHVDHLIQLKNYLRRTRDFVQANYRGREDKFEIRGILIGSRAGAEINNQEKVKQLRYDEKHRSQTDEWEVLSISEVLERTENAHREILVAHEKAKVASR